MARSNTWRLQLHVAGITSRWHADVRQFLPGATGWSDVSRRLRVVIDIIDHVVRVVSARLPTVGELVGELLHALGLLQFGAEVGSRVGGGDGASVVAAAGSGASRAAHGTAQGAVHALGGAEAGVLLAHGRRAEGSHE